MPSRYVPGVGFSYLTGLAGEKLWPRAREYARRELERGLIPSVRVLHPTLRNLPLGKLSAIVARMLIYSHKLRRDCSALVEYLRTEPNPVLSDRAARRFLTLHDRVLGARLREARRIQAQLRRSFPVHQYKGPLPHYERKTFSPSGGRIRRKLKAQPGTAVPGAKGREDDR